MERQDHEDVIRDAMESLRVRLPGRSEQELRSILDEEVAKLAARHVQERLRRALPEVSAEPESPEQANPNAAR